MFNWKTICLGLDWMCRNCRQSMLWSQCSHEIEWSEIGCTSRSTWTCILTHIIPKCTYIEAWNSLIKLLCAWENLSNLNDINKADSLCSWTIRRDSTSSRIICRPRASRCLLMLLCVTYTDHILKFVHS